MEFEYVEYEYVGSQADAGDRISSLLTDNGYHSLRRDTADLVRRYLPGVVFPAAGSPPAAAHTVDALIPPADSAARILLCQRPAANGASGAVVAVVALGRSQNDAHRACTAARLVLDAEGTPGDVAARSRRFRQEWLPVLGLDHSMASSASIVRPLAAAQVLLALKQAPSLLGRPSVLRSHVGKGTDRPRVSVDTETMDRLVPEKLVDRTFVLVCRESGQIIGVREDATEAQGAMPLTLRCPHCRRPLGEEAPDVLYSLSVQGEEFIQSARWIRDAIEAALQRRYCETVAARDGAPGSDIDLAALYHDTVLLVRARDRAITEQDVRALGEAVAAFERAVPGVPVQGAYVASRASSPNGAGDLPPACRVLEVSHLDAALDGLLEDMKQDTFARLAGSSLETIRADLSSVLRPVLDPVVSLHHRS